MTVWTDKLVALYNKQSGTTGKEFLSRLMFDGFGSWCEKAKTGGIYNLIYI